MNGKSHARGALAARPSAKRDSGLRAEDRYRAELRQVLIAAGLTKPEQLRELERFDARRRPGIEHLSDEELTAFDEISEARQKHVDECPFCADLLDCFLSPSSVMSLARRAAKMATRKRPAPSHSVPVAPETKEASDAADVVPAIALSSRDDPF